MAQSASDKAAAEALFDQGRAAMQEGDFARACGLLERSQHIDHGVGTLLYLAECYEKSGRTASAWATFREGADAAASANEQARARLARDRAGRLEPQLSRLLIQVPAETQQIAGLTIERSGKPVPPAFWNVPVPVDPSEYQVTVSAPGYEPWAQTITVPERAAKVAVAVPTLKKAPESDRSSVSPVEPIRPTTPVASGAVPPPAPTPFGSEHGKGQRTAGYVIGAAGIVAVGIGSYFGLRAFSKNGEAKDQCPRGYVCDFPDGPSLADEANNAARASNIAFAVGGVALIGGAVLLLTSPRSPSGTSTQVGVAPTGFILKGSFQ